MNYDHLVTKTKRLVEMIGGDAGANGVATEGPNGKPTGMWLAVAQSAVVLRVLSRHRASLAARSR